MKIGFVFFFRNDNERSKRTNDNQPISQRTRVIATLPGESFDRMNLNIIPVQRYSLPDFLSQSIK